MHSSRWRLKQLFNIIIWIVWLILTYCFGLLYFRHDISGYSSSTSQSQHSGGGRLSFAPEVLRVSCLRRKQTFTCFWMSLYFMYWMSDSSCKCVCLSFSEWVRVHHGGSHPQTRWDCSEPHRSRRDYPAACQCYQRDDGELVGHLLITIITSTWWYIINLCLITGVTKVYLW